MFVIAMHVSCKTFVSESFSGSLSSHLALRLSFNNKFVCVFVCFVSGYVDIGLIPEGARDIRIEEVAESGNFLALRSNNPEKYFLNGDWTIQWTGEYKAAGTVFMYERTGQLENLTSPGPTMEPVWIQVLTSSENNSVAGDLIYSIKEYDRVQLTISDVNPLCFYLV